MNTTLDTATDSPLAPRLAKPDARDLQLFAMTSEIVGCSGSPRWLHTISCPFCGCLHSHVTAVGTPFVKRRSACRAGVYVIHCERLP